MRVGTPPYRLSPKAIKSLRSCAYTGVMRGLAAICLIGLACVAGCSSVSKIKPTFGGYADIDFEYFEHRPAVTIQNLSKSPHGPQFGPFSDTFYVLPGVYDGFAVCNRPPPPDAGSVPALIATPRAPNWNFEMTVDSPGVYRLDCDYKDHKMEVLLKKVSDKQDSTGLD